MHIYILFAHPAKKSFSREVLKAFTEGLKKADHTFEVCDLYEINFCTDMDSLQYERGVSLFPDSPVPEDVRVEHSKISSSDALVFIYPVWWSDCPAKLKGWFDRVWTNGYAYSYDSDGNRESYIKPEKALVICSAGHTVEKLEETGIAESMRCIMLKDRLQNVGFTDVSMEILGGMMPGEDQYRDGNLEKAYQLGVSF